MAVTIQYVFANFFESELVAGLTASSTTMMISPSDAAMLPIITAGSGSQAMIAIWDGQLPPELVAVTTNDHSGTMTITRAQESTVPQAWASGTQVRSSITAGVLNAALAAYFDIGTVLSAHFLSLAGGTLTGPLTLSGPPTAPLNATTKQYVDSVQGTGLPLTGGTMQGNINMAGGSIINLAEAVSPDDAVDKDYVDNKVAPLAPLAGPQFVLGPSSAPCTAPTAAPGDSTTTIATTAFVAGQVGGAAGAWSTGDVKLTYKTVVDTGWIFMDDTTIGASNSNAAHRDGVGGIPANGLQALFTMFWNFPAAWCPMFTAGGASQPRGSTAANDYTAGYSMSMPKVLGRALAIAGTGAGLTARVLSSFVGEETHVLTALESVPHRHVAVLQIPEIDITDAQVVAIGGGGTNGLAEGNFTGTNLARAGVWAANSFGTTGPRLYDAASTADRTGNAIGVSDTQYFGNTTGVAGPAGAHNTMPPEGFLNAMVKY
jgi:hypothetical protein